MFSAIYALRIVMIIIFLVTAVFPSSQRAQGTAVAVPIASLFRTIDLKSLESAEAWPNYNQTRPTTIRMRMTPVLGSAIFDQMSGTTRFMFGFELYAHHVIFMFGAVLIAKFAFEQKKKQEAIQEEKDRYVAREHIEYLERDKNKRSSHMRTRRGYYIKDDVVEVVVI